MKLSLTLRTFFLGPYTLVALIILARKLSLLPVAGISGNTSTHPGVWLLVVGMALEFVATVVAIWQLCSNPARRTVHNFAYLALGLTPLVLAVLMVWGLSHIQG